MKTLTKIVLGLVAAVLVVVVAGGVFFSFFFDPNDYRAKLSAQVTAQTGRSFEIEGELKVNYFPWLGFDVGRTRLGEAEGFGDEPFVTFERASARVKLLPLFKKQVEIGSVELDGLAVNLIKNEQGEFNWESLADGETTGRGAAADQSADPPPASAGKDLALKVGGVSVTDAAIRIVDRQAGSRMAIEKLNFVTGAVDPDKPITVDSSFTLNASEPALVAEVEASGTAERKGNDIVFTDAKLRIAGENQKVSEDLPFANFVAQLTAPQIVSDGETHSVGEAELQLTASGGSGALDTLNARLTTGKIDFAGNVLNLAAPVLAFDGKGKSGALKEFDGKFSGTTLALADADRLTLAKPQLDMTYSAQDLPANSTLSVKGESLSAALEAQTMTFANYTLETLGVSASGTVNGRRIVDAPEFSGPVTLNKFAPRALMKKLDIAVDASDPTALTALSGSGQLKATTNSAGLTGMNLNLDGSTITGDAALANIETGAQTFNLVIDSIDADRYLAPAADAAAGGGGSAADAIEIPAETLRGLNMTGTAKIGRLVFSGIESKNVEFGLTAANGKIRVNPSKAELYGGTYSGDIRVDASGEVPVISMNETVRNLDFAPFVTNVMEKTPLTGLVTGNVVLTARGHNTTQMRETLNGTTDFNFSDGVLKGIDMVEAVRAIVVLSKKEKPVIARGVDRQTAFEKLAGNANVVDGVMTINDVNARMPVFDVKGSGKVNLIDQTLNFAVTTTILESDDELLKDKLKDAVGFKIPVYIAGTFAEFGIVDQGKSAAAIAGQWVKSRVVDRLFDRLKDKDKDKDAAPAEGEGDALADGAEPAAEEEPTPEDKKEALKDEVDKKAKDLLKDIFGGG